MSPSKISNNIAVKLEGRIAAFALALCFPSVVLASVLSQSSLNGWCFVTTGLVSTNALSALTGMRFRSATLVKAIETVVGRFRESQTKQKRRCEDDVTNGRDSVRRALRDR